MKEMIARKKKQKNLDNFSFISTQWIMKRNAPVAPPLSETPPFPEDGDPDATPLGRVCVDIEPLFMSDSASQGSLDRVPATPPAREGRVDRMACDMKPEALVLSERRICSRVDSAVEFFFFFKILREGHRRAQAKHVASVAHTVHGYHRRFEPELRHR